MAHPRRLLPAWPVAPVTAGLFLVGCFGGLWLASAADLSWKAASLVAVLALAALAGMTWYSSRARADRRWRAALDRYAEQQLTKGPTLGAGRAALGARPYRAADGNQSAHAQGNRPPCLIHHGESPLCGSAPRPCGPDTTDGRPLTGAVGCGARNS